MEIKVDDKHRTDGYLSEKRSRLETVLCRRQKGSRFGVSREANETTLVRSTRWVRLKKDESR